MWPTWPEPPARSLFARPGRRGLAIGAALTAVVAAGAAAAIVVPRQAASSDPYERARQLVARMTLDEEISQVHTVLDANHRPMTPGISRLGLPGFYAATGIGGIGEVKHATSSQPVTALPAPIALAATFDPSLAEQYGATMGQEAADWGYSLVRGPDLNIARMPQSGHTFESLGEDPYLASQLAVSEINGLQANHVVAAAQRFAADEQNPHAASSNPDAALDEVIDARTLAEIYLPAFEAAVKEAHVGAVSCGDAELNGIFACQDAATLGVLKNLWRFPGVVLDDANATHSTIADVTAGHDYESATDTYFDAALKQAVLAHKVPKTRLDDMVVRRLGAWIASGSFDHPNVVSPVPMRADGAIARQIAEASMVLLRNTHHILPLNPSHLHQVALIGPDATDATLGGSVAARITPTYTVSPKSGLQSRLNAGTVITVDDGKDLTTATAAAKAADVAVVMIGTTDSETHDRTSLYLPTHMDALVKAVAAANPRTIVVLKTGSAVMMPWLSKVDAVLEAWYPGQEDGDAVADILVGNTNPSGRLPITFPAKPTQVPATTAAAWPGTNGKVTYSEQLEVGYRHYDAANLTPKFPFGFGLSYTTFAYKNLSVSRGSAGTAMVSFDLTNTGKAPGAEVPQVYIGLPSSAKEPPKRLGAFTNIQLFPGEVRHVELPLAASAFAIWDTAAKAWTIPAGGYRIVVGPSSGKAALTGSLTMKSALHLPA